MSETTEESTQVQVKNIAKESFVSSDDDKNSQNEINAIEKQVSPETQLDEKLKKSHENGIAGDFLNKNDPNENSSELQINDNPKTMDESSSATDSPSQSRIDEDENTDEEHSDNNNFQGELDSGYRIITEIVKQNK